jgi:hypothetical protein
VKRLEGEVETAIFILGAGIVIAGVGHISVAVAWILSGLLLCVVAILMYLTRKDRR